MLNEINVNKKFGHECYEREVIKNFKNLIVHRFSNLIIMRMYQYHVCNKIFRNFESKFSFILF